MSLRKLYGEVSGLILNRLPHVKRLEINWKAAHLIPEAQHSADLGQKGYGSFEKAWIALKHVLWCTVRVNSLDVGGGEVELSEVGEPQVLLILQIFTVPQTLNEGLKHSSCEARVKALS